MFLKYVFNNCKNVDHINIKPPTLRANLRHLMNIQMQSD